MKQEKDLASDGLNQSAYAVPKKNKKIGLFLIAGPIVGLIATLVIWSILTFLFGAFFFSSPSSFIWQNIANVIFGLIGLICVLGIMIGLPFGIIYSNKKELVKNHIFDERSGKGEASIVPEEIKGWNWGAFGLSWIWGVYYGVWISLLMFVPVINLFVWFFLGSRGSEWAWKAQRWESVEEFMRSQNKWRPWGIVFSILSVLVIIADVILEG